MSALDSKYGSFGSNWGTPQNYPTQASPDVPMYAQPDQGGYTNAMDMSSDGYANAGMANFGGMAYGQSMGGGVVPSGGGGMFSSLGQWGKDSGFMGSLDTKTGIKTDGWGGAAMGAATSIFNAYMGMKQYGLAKEQFKFNKDMTKRNFNAQANQVNMAISDRDNARNASGQASNNSGYKVATMG